MDNIKKKDSKKATVDSKSDFKENASTAVKNSNLKSSSTENPLNNIFTNISQPTPFEKINSDRIKGFTNNSGGNLHINPESGELYYENIEFVIHGKNGFEYPVKRVYSSANAKADCPSVAAFLNRYGFGKVNSAYILNGMGVPINMASICYAERTSPTITDESLKKSVQSRSENGLTIGAGWRLSIPYVDKNEVLTFPDGGCYMAKNMKNIQYQYKPSTSGFDACEAYENHRGEDFTFLITRKIAEKDSRGMPTKWDVVNFELIMKNGLTYIFNKNGQTEKIYDPSGDNTIVINYTSDSFISSITEPFGGKIYFTYQTRTSYLCPVISKIEFADSNNTILSSIDYTYASLSDEKQKFNFIPLLASSSDMEGRKETYAYKKCTEENNLAGYPFDDKDTIDQYLKCSFYDIISYSSGTWNSKKLGQDMPELLQAVTSPYGLIQSIYYKRNVAKIITSEIGAYTPNSMSKVMAESLIVKNGKKTSAKTFEYTLALHSNGQIITKNTVISDRDIKTLNTYDEKKESDGSYNCYLSKSEIYRNVGSKKEDLRSVDYVWNSSYRIDRETVTSGINECVKTFSYDSWGNITQETVSKISGKGSSRENIITHITKSRFYNTNSSEIADFPGGVPSTSVQSTAGTKNLLINQEIKEILEKSGGQTRSVEKFIVQKGFAYDSYGRLTWEGIYNSSHWAARTFAYTTKSNSEPWKGGNLEKITSPCGQVYEYSYQLSGRNLTTKITARNVNLGGNGLHDIDTTNVTDIHIGKILSHTDGKGNTTTFTYDKTGRQNSKTTPDGITELTAYDTENRVIIFSRTINGNSHTVTAKHYHDSRGNIIKIERYNTKNLDNGDFSAISEIFEFNDYNNLSSYTDECGNRTVCSYDTQDRLVRQTNPDETFIKKTYYDASSCFEVTDEDNHTHREAFDFDANTILTERYIGKMNGYERQAWEYIYSTDGKLLEEINPYGYSTKTDLSVFGTVKHQFKDVINLPESNYPEEQTPRLEYDYTDDGLVKTEYDGVSFNPAYVMRTKKYTYNGLGQKLSMEAGSWCNGIFAAEKRTTKYEYDKAGNLIKETNPDDTFKTYSYNSMNRCDSKTDEEGGITKYEYNHDGKITKITDAMGFVSEYFYDDFNRLYKAELPPVPGKTGKNIINIQYDKHGNVRTVLERSGKVSDYGYDSRNRRIRETVTDGVNKTEKRWMYTGIGKVWKEIIGCSGNFPDGTPDTTNCAVTEYKYDSWNRLEKKIFPDGRTENYLSDLMERFIKVTYADGSYKSFEYNNLNHLTKQTDEEGNVTEFYHNVWGNQTYRVLKDSNNNILQTFRTGYNMFGEKTLEESSSGQTWNYTNNSRGLIAERTDPNGIKLTSGYDGCGRVKTETRTFGSRTQSKSYVYDKAGFLKQGTDGDVSAGMNLNGNSYVSNAYGLVTGIKTTVDGKNLSETFGYDLGQRINSIEYPDSSSVKFTYNGIGQTVSVGTVNNATAYANGGVYDSAGHLTKLTAANGTERTESWNQVKAVLDNYSWGISGKSLNSIAWNNRGNILSQTKNSVPYSYIYDKKNQLKQENRSNSPLSAWSYEANGNRNSEAKSGGSAKTITCYPKSDLIKSDGSWKYNYDANGNMVAKGTIATATGTDTAGSGNFTGWAFSVTSGEVWTYEYDLCNRLVKVNHSTAGTNNLKQVTEYKYDYRDLMVCRTVGTGAFAVKEYFAYSPDGKLLYTEKGTEKHDYVYANGKLWCEIVTTNGIKNTYYHHTDYLGTTVCITDTSGKIVWECEKDSFGVIVSKTNSSFTPNFTGKLLDENTGLYYFNARWYDAEMGRFITEDPARDGGNWFVYCGNNPLSYTDPAGLYTEDADALLEKQHQSFLREFKSQVFTKDNPLNQLDFDKAMRIPSDSKTTQSCFTAAIINAYASNCKNGITGEEICNVFLDIYGYFNDLIDKDGSPNPEKDIDSISKALAKEKGMDKYIHLGAKNQNLKIWGAAGVITGLSKNGEKKDSHFVYEDKKKGKIDSMDSKRPSAKNYNDNSHRVLIWRRLSDE